MSHSLSSISGDTSDLVRVKRALISVSDKTNLVEFARGLVTLGVELLSTGGTAKTLSDAEVPVVEIGNYTGFPEILDGRVKTLHPKVHGGLLAVRGNEKHESEIAECGIEKIDLVVMNLYPFESTVQSGADFEKCIENIDIGGPSMLRSSAKNHQYVTIVTSPTQYNELLKALEENSGSTQLQLRRKYAAQAFAISASYDRHIATFFAGQIDPSTSQIVTREYQPQFALKYGCNPQQQPADVFSLKGQGLPFEVINGQPGYINLLDAVNSWCLVSELCAVLGGDIPVAASFKHCSPSGVALGIPLTSEEHAMYEITPIMSAEEALTPTAIAYLRARNSDPMCSYGDFAALSHPVDEATARQFQTAVCDGVIAPGYTPEALSILTKKKKGAFIVLQSRPDFVFDQVEYRELSGVVLSQARNSTLVNQEHLQNIVCARGIAGSDQNAMKELNEPLLSVDATRDLLLATTTVKYTQSNSVAYALGGQVIGVGAGQQSRVDCVKLAGRKVSTWFLRRHPKVMGLPFKEGVKRQDRINARVRFIEGDITAAEMPLWRDHFTATPEPLGEDEKRSFLEEGLRGVSIASDGFFPFRDSIDHASKYGVEFVAQPGGSIADKEVIEACCEYGMTMAFTELRLFHH